MDDAIKRHKEALDFSDVEATSQQLRSSRHSRKVKPIETEEETPREEAPKKVIKKKKNKKSKTYGNNVEEICVDTPPNPTAEFLKNSKLIYYIF